MRWLWSKETNSSKQATGNKKQSKRGEKKAHTLISEIRCPLCGKKFHAGEAMQCSACAIAVQCGLVMCPNCNYEFIA